jgi:hypothetical protein
MKICVVMYYDSNVSEYADLNFKINKLYCDKYNFDIIFLMNQCLKIDTLFGKDFL